MVIISVYLPNLSLFLTHEILHGEKSSVALRHAKGYVGNPGLPTAQVYNVRRYVVIMLECGGVGLAQFYYPPS